MKNTNTEESLKSKNEQCSICLLEIPYPRCRLNCNHEYCIECIQEWGKSSEVCPLCNKKIAEALQINSDGTFNQLLLEYKPVQKELSLDCLDHSYFRQEIAKLLRLCYEVEVTRFKQRNAKGTPAEWRALQYIKSSLENFKAQNDNFLRFNPEELLKELYELSSDINAISIGSLPAKYSEILENNYVEISDEEDYD